MQTYTYKMLSLFMQNMEKSQNNTFLARALVSNNKLVLKVFSHIGGRSSSSCQRDWREACSGMGEGLLVLVSSLIRLSCPIKPTEPASCLSIIWGHFLGVSSASLGGGATELRVKLRKLPWLLKQSRAVKGRLRNAFSPSFVWFSCLFSDRDLRRKRNVKF